MASLVAQVSESRVDPIPGDSLIVLAPGIEIPAVNPGYVLWLPDDRSVSGMVVFTRPRRANEPTDDFISYATENDLAVLYAHTHNRLEFLFDESSMDLLLGYIAEVCRLYDIPRDRLLYCGMSLEGTRALKLAIRGAELDGELRIGPQAIDICDAPLDFFRFHREATTARDRSISEVAANEGRWVSAQLEDKLGDPVVDREAYVDYSPYCHAAYGGPHLPVFADIAVRAYTEPDVLWWMETRGKDYYGMNAVDAAGLINELHYLDNESAELILTEDKGYHPDGSRHPHSWSIVDEKELIDWFFIPYGVNSVRMKRFLILVLILSWTTSLPAQEQGVFKDTLDGASDLSHFLFDLHGFLPIVSPITEPAVGYGAVLMNAFFIPKKGESERLFRMPDVAFGGGGLTENGTWFLGGGYLGFWNEDRVRYRGFAGYGSINLTYYAFSEVLDRELAIEYNLSSTFLHQEANWRIGETDLFIGGSYRFVRTRVSSERDPDDLIPSVDREITTSGLGAQIQYDHRDNVFSPTSGFITSLSLTYYPDELGSTRDYGQLIWYLNYYIPIGSKWISGFRAQSNWAVADPPFYALPYIELRGVPNLRYQGDWIGLIETEQQFRLTRRWALLGFAGYGWAQSKDALTRSDATAWNAGGGFRYLLARAFGLQTGIDVGRGPEQWAFYVVVGSSWGR